MALAPAQPKPASLFGLPGITRPTEQAENNDGATVVLAQGSQKVVTGLIPFKQTDVIKCWRLEVSNALTLVPGTQTINLTTSFPYAFIGNLKLNYQNQFNTVDLFSGFDAAIFQSYRPYYSSDTGRNLLDTTPAPMPYNAQANLVSASNYTSASSTVNFVLDLPGGLDFDRFWPLDANGNIVGAPVRAFVSPQYMAGTARIVQPSITFNQGFGTQDASPYFPSGTPTTPATFADTATLGFQRVGWYQPSGPADSPVIYNWQYTRKSVPFSISGKQIVDLTLPQNGQILSVFIRAFDPSVVVSSQNVGAPIAITALTKTQLLYGSGLYRFQDTPLRMQERFMRQHQILPPSGVLVWDMALNNQGIITNEDCLNTMTTSGITVHLEFTAAQSATAYVVVGVEALQYVEVA